MAGKKGVGDLVVAARKTGLVAKTKRLVGISSTCGIIGFFFIPGPHTVAVVLGMAAGVVIAKMTGKKK